MLGYYIMRLGKEKKALNYRLSNTMKKKSLRITAALAALAIIYFIIQITTSFVGNPFTKHKASKAIQTYLDTTYPHRDFILESVNFNFKFDEYCGNVISPSSKDSYFTIYWKKGKITDDSYEFNVVNKLNTVQRYEKEAASQIRTLLSDVTTIDLEDLHVSFSKEWLESMDLQNIQLDSDYDKSMNLPLELWVTAISDSPTLKEYSDILIDLNDKLKSNGFNITYYNISSRFDCSIGLNASNISQEEIESGNLQALLEAALNSEDEYDERKAYEEKLNSVPTKEDEILYKDKEVPAKKIYVNSFIRTE